MGSDPIETFKQKVSDAFQSTLPVWGATAGNDYTEEKAIISIHAPRVGSDAGIPKPDQKL